MKVEYLERFYKDLDKIKIKAVKDKVVEVISNVKGSDVISAVKNNELPRRKQRGIK